MNLLPDEGTSVESGIFQVINEARLMTLYHKLHASVHAKNSHLKILRSVGHDTTSLAWSTPVFEFYCVAGPNLSLSTMTQGANKIIQWIRHEEEKFFIVGGAVF